MVKPGRSVDYIIVGQGIAGSCVALQLLRAGYTLAVFDNPSENKSSVIAAGLFNPITGKKTMVKTWLADTLFPYLQEFYRDAENITAANFFFPMPLYRPFQGPEEQNEWMGYSTDPGFSQFINKIATAPAFAGVQNNFGGLFLKQCGYLDTRAFLLAVKNVITARGAYQQGAFSYDRLNIADDGVRYGDLSATAIIFCEGNQVAQNPWFRHVKVQALKGETLTIKCDWNEQVILNRSVYMVPGKVEKEFKIGATYNLKDTEQATTLAARQELEEKMKNLIELPYEIKAQEWGVRPTTVDRRPIVGKHPKFDHLYILNGLGTKGVSLAPYFSRVLVQTIQNVIRPGKEVDVTRFKLLY